MEAAASADQGQALNRCIELIALTEKRIGEELVKEQRPGGSLFGPRQNRSRPAPGADRHQGDKVAVAELGLTKQQNRDFKAMAAAACRTHVSARSCRCWRCS